MGVCSTVVVVGAAAACLLKRLFLWFSYIKNCNLLIRINIKLIYISFTLQLLHVLKVGWVFTFPQPEHLLSVVVCWLLLLFILIMVKIAFGFL